MRKIRILNIVPDIYTEGIAVSVKDRQALAAALKEETGGLVVSRCFSVNFTKSIFIVQ